METLVDEQSLQWDIALLRSPGIGPRRFAKLIEIFGSAETVFQVGEVGLLEAGLPAKVVAGLKKPNRRAVDADLAWMQSSVDHHIVGLGHSNYPELLKQIPDPPPLLFVRGQVSLLNEPQLALVGSRNPSHGGLEHAAEFARALASYGMVITSGLALGIDAAAHRGALHAAQGTTIAVMGTGPEQVYPKRHKSLAEAIVARGALVTEFPPGAPAIAENFPRRNRIISGMSAGVLVVEANLKSGSLITARLAAEQGREVFAIPGSIHNPVSRGCHYLIKQGAKLVESLEDIREEFSAGLVYPGARSSKADRPDTEVSAADESTAQLLSGLGFDPMTMDQIIESSQLTSDQVSSILLTLELQGVVSALPGGFYCRRA